MSAANRPLLLWAASVVLFCVAGLVLPDYHQGMVARVMVLAVFAAGYNFAYGYGGLLSLGHAMFFAAGVYGAALPLYYFGTGLPVSFLAGVAAAGLLALATGALALRTTGAAFMIVTLMFSQAAYLTVLYFNRWTGGDQGLVLPRDVRQVSLGGHVFDPTLPDARYFAALGLFALASLTCVLLVRSRYGRVLVAMRENEERARMLGFDPFANKLAAVAVSGLLSGAAGAAYALLFGYAGASFASVQYSILPLLWVLLGGAGTSLGPLIGTLAMTYLIDFSGDFLNRFLPDANISSLGVVGAALILLVLFFPKGIAGMLREKSGRAGR